jgi:hypothetical protein
LNAALKKRDAMHDIGVPVLGLETRVIGPRSTSSSEFAR